MAKNMVFQVKIQTPIIQKSKIAPKIFSRLLIFGLTLSIAKVLTRSGCYTWDTSLVSLLQRGNVFEVLRIYFFIILGSFFGSYAG